MQAPKYIESNISYKKSLQHAQELHEKKLQSIKTRKPYSYLDPKNSPKKLPQLKIRWKSASNSIFHIVRIEEIRNENLILLKKLLNISRKKIPSLGCISFNKKKSLNIAKRKRDSEKICFENVKIARRIVEQAPKVDVKNNVKEYKGIIDMKKRLSRANMLVNRRFESLKRIANTSIDKVPSTRKLNIENKKGTPPCIKKTKSMIGDECNV